MVAVDGGIYTAAAVRYYHNNTERGRDLRVISEKKKHVISLLYYILLLRLCKK